MTHVPYRGQTPEITDILSGQIPLGFTTTDSDSRKANCRTERNQ